MVAMPISSQNVHTAPHKPSSSPLPPKVEVPVSQLLDGRKYPVKGPLIFTEGQRVHSLSQRGYDVLAEMSGEWAETRLLPMLGDPKTNWQPQDLLPDPRSKDFADQMHDLQRRTADLPLDLLVVLVGDMVTEEALPSYQSMLNLNDATRDETGASTSAWAQWTRSWTAEENRHGDLLNKYLWLTGRVDMRSVEVTIQKLIGSGLNPQLENNPYLTFIYTSAQEHATKLSHGRTARLAKESGDLHLARVCGTIAADEARHQQAYERIIARVFELDPDGGISAYADMVEKGILMPAHLCDDGEHLDLNPSSRSLFADYASVAERLGVYTANDYADILEHLNRKWKVAEMQHLSGEGARCQEFLMAQPSRIRRLAQLSMERRERDAKKGKERVARFSWVGRDASIQL